MKEKQHISIEQDEADFVTGLYEKFHRLVEKIAHGVCRDKETAKDAAIQTFLNLLGRVEMLRTMEENALAFYMKVAARNTSIREISKQQKFWKRQQALEEYYAREPSPEEESEEADSFSSLLSGLSQRDQTLLFFSYYLDCSNQEIAKELGIREESVRVYLHRARQRLRKFLDEEGSGDEKQ